MNQALVGGEVGYLAVLGSGQQLYSVVTEMGQGTNVSEGCFGPVATQL